MQKRLKDLRTTITTMTEAMEVFDSIAHTQLKLEKADAEFELRMARMKAEHQERTKPFCTLRDGQAADLVAFIHQNKPLFKSPRKVKTAFGSFGLQKANDLIITDKEALIQSILDRGYDDCLKVTSKPLKKAIAARIEENESFPGCTVRTGDTAVYTVAKALVDEARGAASNE